MLYRRCKKAKEHSVEENVKFFARDARKLDKIVKDEEKFDAVINTWTSIGYYNEETDQNFSTRPGNHNFELFNSICIFA